MTHSGFLKNGSYKASVFNSLTGKSVNVGKVVTSQILYRNRPGEFGNMQVREVPTNAAKGTMPR